MTVQTRTFLVMTFALTIVLSYPMIKAADNAGDSSARYPRKDGFS